MEFCQHVLACLREQLNSTQKTLTSNFVIHNFGASFDEFMDIHALLQENRAVLKIVTPSNINLGEERKKSQTCINYVIRTLTVEN